MSRGIRTSPHCQSFFVVVVVIAMLSARIDRHTSFGTRRLGDLISGTWAASPYCEDEDDGAGPRWIQTMSDSRYRIQNA